MDSTRSTSGNGEDNVGIPDDLRCKRTDGKQWRCTAMSMPDKTVCEKHYIQAKRRAANSALRASLRKAKRKSVGESEEVYFESKGDDFDMPLANFKVDDHHISVSGKKHKEKVPKNQVRYSPETPPMRNLSGRNSLKPDDDLQMDVAQFEENLRSSQTPTLSAMDSSWKRSHMSFDANAITESSDGSTNSYEDTGGQTCHQCRRNDRERVFWCLRCDRRGFCDLCISTCYSDLLFEEIEKVCPVCRGICNCKVCVRGDNTIKVRIREIPALDKLQYLCCLLSSVLPVIKKIHHEQCLEVELEKKLRGTDMDLVRAKLSADEQMCCNSCRIPIIDYHWHCTSCSYDLCLSCCRDLAGAYTCDVKGEAAENQISERSQDKGSVSEQLKASRSTFNLSERFPYWKPNGEGSIPCPPKEYSGCGYPSLSLNRIFKMNWIAKLAKNVEEMVSGCKIHDAVSSQKAGLDDPKLCQFAHREDSDDNYLYCPSSQDIKNQGIGDFRKHWARGEPVIVTRVCDSSCISSWDPMVIWRGIRETADEKTKDENRMVKAIDCVDFTEVDIELDLFIKGYSKGRIREDGWPEMLKLKDWPSPSASEEFLLYHRPEFISKLPLLEFIHSRGDSVVNLQINMRDLVYLLVHTCEVKQKGLRSADDEKKQSCYAESEVNYSFYKPETSMDEEGLPNLALCGHDMKGDIGETYAANEDEIMEDQGADTSLTTIEKTDSIEQSKIDSVDASTKTRPGARWDVFRQQDVPKIIEYLQLHSKDFGKLDYVVNNPVIHPLFGGAIFLNGHHKKQLKENFGVEPWSFEQNLGEAVFVPTGCAFQVKNLQSTVQLGLDFLSPESVGEAFRLAEEIRCLPNDNDAKLQVLEVGKMSLYAASFAIKEVQKLVLDPKVGAEIGFEDPNLTAMVSENLENVTKHRQITCA
ncbi:lysine-specific demethylase JMJ25-like isoform X2 [Tripterygium wilfordii]|uniref:lysine-specific demethylase JMJ25-like isoform X2 n=1 Tax=Tripterygium wilfordii TaxID=458696 RepID=UPI0018F8148A|nr:lysine-specific demethylase JMJ25-like isoform X2 [Tripterygium wilfordii]